MEWHWFTPAEDVVNMFGSAVRRTWAFRRRTEIQSLIFHSLTVSVEVPLVFLSVNGVRMRPAVLFCWVSFSVYDLISVESQASKKLTQGNRAKEPPLLSRPAFQRLQTDHKGRGQSELPSYREMLTPLCWLFAEIIKVSDAITNLGIHIIYLQVWTRFP